jgi:hypothetical protein
MPSTSLGIAYPCLDPLVNPADFATFATTTETAIAATQALTPALLRRDFVKASGINPNTATGVTSTVSWTNPIAVNNPSGMFNAGTPTVFTVQSAGSFLVSLHVHNFTFPTTATSLRGAVLLAGVEQVWAKWPQSGTANVGSFHVDGHIISAAVGQQITCTFLWTGTGGPITPDFDIQICKISDL